MRTIVLTLKDVLGRDVLQVPIATIGDCELPAAVVPYMHRLVVPVEAAWVVATVEGSATDSLAGEAPEEYSGEGEGSGGNGDAP